MWDVLLRFRSSSIRLHIPSCEDTTVSQEPAIFIPLWIWMQDFRPRPCSAPTGDEEILGKMTAHLNYSICNTFTSDNYGVARFFYFWINFYLFLGNLVVNCSNRFNSSRKNLNLCYLNTEIEPRSKPFVLV